MKWWIDFKTGVFIQFGIFLIRRLGSASDKTIISILTVVLALFKKLKNEEACFFLQDVLDMYRKGPAYTGIVKEMLTKSETEEFKKLLYGFLYPPERFTFLPGKPVWYPPAMPFHSAESEPVSEKVKIGLVMESPFYTALYREPVEQVSRHGFTAEAVSVQEIEKLTSSELKLFLVIGGMMFNLRLAGALLERSRDVLMWGAPASDDKELQNLQEKAKQTGCRIFFASPSIYFNPYATGLNMVREYACGRVSQVRIKTVVSGCTSDEAKDMVELDLHDKLSLAKNVLGEVRESRSYTSSVHADGSFTVVNMYRHILPRAHTVYEFTYSNGLKDSAHAAPVIEKIEITGDSGILWLNWQKTKLLNEPVITLYRGDKEHKLGAVEDDFHLCLTKAFQGFIA